MVRIFKTDIRDTFAVNAVRVKLDELLWFAKWNFDLEDQDRILRVEYPDGVVFSIEEGLQKLGLSCVELH
ncbi:hypothetical protein [Flavobacterium selenitireducens]|uniref:hypothetical protein n=1 Tax=Flavobacterium selenitireducens TaxID=2722704 RepID=UPI00168ADE25|nr:hypothetical protein [Flavobacterium selenitireducens]MBD3582862.1 hypothetical protein [Flavobacterium selenitireducens]